jgi:predicted short-subunit dehydrogenase-like oxidoreductase (DUF2520 family)
MLRVGLIGPGRAGQALVRLLPPSDYEIGPVLARSYTSARRAVRQMRLGEPTDDHEDFRGCDLILITVPDDAVAGVARALAGVSFSFRRKIVLHTSGALSSAELAPLRARRASVGSLHPLQTFGRRMWSLAGVYFAVEGDEAARRMAQTLVTAWRGKLLRIKSDQKALYHAAATFASPLLAPLIEAAALLMSRAGVPPKRAIQALLPLITTTLQNFAHTGKQSWTGPLARGDAATIRRHLEALARADAELARYYRCSARAALILFKRHPELLRILRESEAQ